METIIDKTKMTDQELILYLKLTIDNICDLVRNKMMAPYSALQIANDSTPPKELVDISLDEIRWLCHNYIPKISAEVSTHTN